MSDTWNLAITVRKVEFGLLHFREVSRKKFEALQKALPSPRFDSVGQFQKPSESPPCKWLCCGRRVRSPRTFPKHVILERSHPSDWVEDFHLLAIEHAWYTKKGGAIAHSPSKTSE